MGKWGLAMSTYTVSIQHTEQKYSARTFRHRQKPQVIHIDSLSNYMTLSKLLDFPSLFGPPPSPPQLGITQKLPENQMLHQSQYFLEASLADFFEKH